MQKLRSLSAQALHEPAAQSCAEPRSAQVMRTEPRPMRTPSLVCLLLCVALMHLTHLPQSDAAHVPSSMVVPGLVGVECQDRGGRALLAARAFPAGSLLVVFGGAVLNAHQIEPLLPDVARLTLQIDEDAFLVTTIEGPGDWVNHSCDPNAWLDGQISLIARRDIEAGEEITFDYATSDSCPYDEFECHCGSMLCRGTLAANDWTRPELSERYEGHFSPYLQRRLLALRAGGFRAA